MIGSYDESESDLLIWQGPPAESEIIGLLSSESSSLPSALDAHIMSFGLTIGTERAIALQVRTNIFFLAQY
jgi:hypothetical protein